MQHVPVGAVQLDDVEADLYSTPGRGHEIGLELVNLLQRDRAGLHVLIAERDGARGEDVAGPAADVLGGDRGGAQPGGHHGALAPGVGQLDADLLALRVGELDVLPHGLHLLVSPQARVLWRDATAGLHRAGFDDAKTGLRLLAVFCHRGKKTTRKKKKKAPRMRLIGEGGEKHTPRWTIPPIWVVCQRVRKPFSAEY